MLLDVHALARDSIMAVIITNDNSDNDSYSNNANDNAFQLMMS